ncbi:MAG TPA: PhoU domain-containing protein [Rhodothermales bacterium]
MSLLDLFRGSPPPLVAQSLSDVQLMLERGHTMFAEASAHLLQNEVLEVDLARLDEDVNGAEQRIRRSVLGHLSIDPNRDLVFSLKLISIVQEAERIGDLCKSLAKVAALADGPRMGPRVDALREMQQEILEMFELTRRAFVKSDEASADLVMQRHESIKKKSADYLTELAHATDVTTNQAVVYALGSRILSRVSAHLANIGSAVASSFDRLRRKAV